MAIIVKVENNIETREEPIPDGYVVIDSYSPHSCPWDYYGGKHQREYCKVLELGGVEYVALYTNYRVVHPVGTGPGGSVRFGDDMMPGLYRIAVREKDKAAAENLIERHKSAIHEWIMNGAEMPIACRA